MKVYFTAHVTGNHKSGQYAAILEEIERRGHTLTSGKQIIDKEQLQADAKLTPEEIFSREKTRITESDCVVADVTYPSSGVGSLIVYALVLGKPVLALFYQNAEYSLSPIIAGNPSDQLYREHYDEDTIAFKLKSFFKAVELRNRRNGKLIVIDGGDGSGKATQSEMLIESLRKKGYRVKYMDFPRYYTSFHGKVVGRFLSGEFGSLDQVSPYLASLAYALDRASAKEEMDDWLSTGGILLCNRYATSSMAHQAAKLPPEKRQAFIDWVDEMEYKVHKIPREDIVVYLYVPWKIGYELTLKKSDRGYLKGKLDIAEADVQHRIESEAMYLDLAKNRSNWTKISCVSSKKTLYDKEKIHEDVVKALKKNHIIV
jgi:dTMP kinase